MDDRRAIRSRGPAVAQMIDSHRFLGEMAMITKALAAIGALGIALCLSSHAEAAMTVLGAGPAVDCFHYAESGLNLRDGISSCTFALDTALSPTDRAATFINRGLLKLSLHENDAAFADMNSGIEIAPNLGDAYVDRGAVSIALGHYDEALADLNKGISLEPHRPQIAYYDRAIVNEHNGDIRGAYEDYKKALDIAPDFAPAGQELKRFRVVHKASGA
jgi:tetratricopeptide (TPR) repeat protein